MAAALIHYHYLSLDQIALSSFKTECLFDESEVLFSRHQPFSSSSVRHLFRVKVAQLAIKLEIADR